MRGITIIAAADGWWGIGREGAIPWNVPEDLARFRRRTMGKTVIVGRRTAESLPEGLPGRRLAVVSSSGGYRSVAEAVAEESRNGAEIFIAGGAGIYREALGLAEAAEITRIRGRWPCDTFMPDLAAEGWYLSSALADGALKIEIWGRKR